MAPSIPVVTFREPNDGVDVNGIYTIVVEATVSGGTIASVDINFNSGDWLECNPNTETGFWEYNWDTTKAVNERYYYISARASAI